MTALSPHTRTCSFADDVTYLELGQRLRCRSARARVATLQLVAGVTSLDVLADLGERVAVEVADAALVVALTAVSAA